MAKLLPRVTQYYHHCASTVTSSSLRESLLPNSRLVRIQNRSPAEKVSDSNMENHSQAKGEAMDHVRECQGKEACEFGSSKRVSDRIMPHVLNLYGSCAKPSDFNIYAPDASFEDPLMCAHGVKQIKSAFYSLSKVFSESRIVEYTLQENVTSPGKQEILIDNKQHYKFLGRSIDVVSIIKLHVENGKVVRHEDWWDKQPLKNRDTVSLPLVGRAIEMARRGSMLVTHTMMGFGKDPDQS